MQQGRSPPLEQQTMSLSGNPIRRVVSLLQGMAKKIKAEGEVQKQLYDKFMCSCKKQRAESAQAIAETKGKDPQMESDIKESQEKIKQLKLELLTSKADIKTATSTMSSAQERREQEYKEYVNEKAEMDGFIGVLAKAIPAIEKGMSSSFLQAESGAKMMLTKAVNAAQDAPEYDKESVASFLSNAADAPESGEITGILKTMQAEYKKNSANSESENAENTKLFDELMGAKTRQTKTCAAAIEKKTAQIGQISVNIVNMKGEISSAQAARAANEKFAQELDESCNSRAAENDKALQARGAELVAVHDTIHMLSSDAALDLMKKSLPATSLLQVQEGMPQQRKRALAIVRSIPRHGNSMTLDFLSLSLSGRKANFLKVVKMVDAMVKILKSQDVDDAAQLEYCSQKIAGAEDKKKVLATKVSDMKHQIGEQEDIVQGATEEIKAVEEAIGNLDAAVKEATEQRKAENSAYTATMSTDSAAKELLSVAKERLNKFYNPSKSGASASFAQISEHRQHSARAACRSVIGMLDTLVRDLEKEMLEAKLEEKNAEKDYVRLLEGSKGKRTTNVKAIEQKQGTKAEGEAARVEFQEASEAEKAELMATDKYAAQLHSQCDWLVANADLRAKSRTEQMDQLTAAKDVLSGASLLQSKRHLRGAE